MLQLVDQNDECLHVWTGGAATALRCRRDLERDGRTIVVADQKGRQLTASDLVELAAVENERHASASIKAFWQLQRRALKSVGEA